MSDFSNEVGLAPADIPLFEGLFGSSGSRRVLSWQVARKAGHCLVLARKERSCLASGLSWYRALRPKGKFYRAVLGCVSDSPLWRVLPERRIGLSDDGLVAELEGSGLGRVEAILFGNPVQEHRRVMLKLAGRRVVKAGFSAAAREAIEREVAVLEKFGGTIPGVPQAITVLRSERSLALVTEECQGEPLGSFEEGVTGALVLVDSWLSKSAPKPLSDFNCWSALRCSWPGEGLEKWADLLLRPAFHHGDFAAWNLLKTADGEIRAVDWEWGGDDFLPGLDIVHFVVQENAMVKRLAGGRLVERSLTMLDVVGIRNFLQACGWPSPELALACYACLLNPIFMGPDGENLKELCLKAVS